MCRPTVSPKIGRGTLRRVDSDRRNAELLLRAMHEHTADDDDAALGESIHEDAEMRLLVSHGEILRGRAEILRALARGAEATTFRAEVERFEWLDATTSLTFAHARYSLENGGVADGRVYWLDEIRDGKIWRVRVYRSEVEARAAYRNSSG